MVCEGRPASQYESCSFATETIVLICYRDSLVLLTDKYEYTARSPKEAGGIFNRSDTTSRFKVRFLV